jgi:predicted Rossmann fold flavoprotein
VDVPVDLAIVGAGAAGLMAAIQAGRAARAAGRAARIVVLDGARTLGAKILVAGGGRCNVTHHAVTADDFAGASRNSIAKVLRAFDVDATVDFFTALAVPLKREPTGKLFPVTDQARTVLEALLAATAEAGVELRYPRRVTTLAHDDEGFTVGGEWGTLRARRVILAAGGRSLPRSGSDGSGYALAAGLGHTISQVFPALVPLLLPEGHALRALSGISTPVRLEVRRAGARVATCEGALLCTHFGLSGPAVLDISRHWNAERLADGSATVSLLVNWLPTTTDRVLDEALQSLGPRSVGRLLTAGGPGQDRPAGPGLPDRLAATLCALAEVDPATVGHRLTREARRRLVATLTALELPVSGDRGWVHAEVTAGGVPLTELHLATMESRRCPGLYLAGEILDVDGRLGGFNFQWSWASGTVAGRAAGRD